MALQVYEGDLLDQDVEVIVNAWNGKIILCRADIFPALGQPSLLTSLISQVVFEA